MGGDTVGLDGSGGFLSGQRKCCSVYSGALDSSGDFSVVRDNFALYVMVHLMTVGISKWPQSVSLYSGAHDCSGDSSVARDSVAVYSGTLALYIGAPDASGDFSVARVLFLTVVHTHTHTPHLSKLGDGQNTEEKEAVVSSKTKEDE